MAEADVIVHSGDISNNGTEEEVLDFLNWFIDLPYSEEIRNRPAFRYSMLYELDENICVKK